MSILTRLFNRNADSIDGIDLPETPQPAPAKKARSSSRKSGKGSMMDAGDVELLGNAEGTVVVGFGLRWRTQVTDGGRESAQKLAAKSKATHYFFRTPQIGYGKLPKQVTGPVYPAALLAAKSHAGGAVFALEIASGQYWFAIVRNGLPTNTDEMVSDMTPAEAAARIRSLVQQFEGEAITVFSNLSNVGIDGVRSFSLHDLFDIVRSDADQLQAIGKAKNRIPKPALYFALASFLVLVGKHGYQEWNTYQLEKARAANQVTEDSPELAWAPVLAQFLASTPKPSNDTVVELRKGLAKLPVMWHGWSLTGARCQAGEMVALARPWSCQGTYDRGRIADTSEQMLKQVNSREPQWSAVFPTINTMLVGWSINRDEQAIALVDLPEPASTTLRLVSHLQGFLPALSIRPEFQMTPFELAAPKRQDGTPHPKPSTIPDLFKGDLSVKGPLRSIDALAQGFEFVQWDSMGLIFDAKAPPSQKGLTASSLVVELNGKVFGKK